MIQAHLADCTELAGHPARLLVLPPGTTGRIDVLAQLESPEALWTRAKSATAALRAVVLTPGCPSVADHGFDVVHRIVEDAAAQVAGSAEEVGAIEIAITDVIQYEQTAAELDGTTGPWELETPAGGTVRIEWGGPPDSGRERADTATVEVGKR